MKIMKGGLKETQFLWPAANDKKALVEKESKVYNTNDVTYINGLSY